MLKDFLDIDVKAGAHCCSCCGTTVGLETDKEGVTKTVSRKWKNQHGSGVTETKVSVGRSPVGQHKGIYMAFGKVGKARDDEEYQVTHVKTKNGVLTIGCKVKW